MVLLNETDDRILPPYKFPLINHVAFNASNPSNSYTFSPGSLYYGLVRHARTFAVGGKNFSGIDDNNPKVRLTDEGKLDAFNAAKALLEAGLTLDLLLSSDLERTRGTAYIYQQVFEYLGPVFTDGLYSMERDFASIDGMRRDDFTSQELRDLNNIFGSKLQRQTGVESMGAFHLRAASFLMLLRNIVQNGQLATENLHVLHFSHAGFINAIDLALRTAVYNSGRKDLIAGEFDDFKPGDKLPYPYIWFDEGLKRPIPVLKLDPCCAIFLTQSLIEIIPFADSISQLIGKSFRVEVPISETRRPVFDKGGRLVSFNKVKKIVAVEAEHSIPVLKDDIARQMQEVIRLNLPPEDSLVVLLQTLNSLQIKYSSAFPTLLALVGHIVPTLIK